MNRITNKDLDEAVSRLNDLTGNPQAQYTDSVLNPGNYHLYLAYGANGLNQHTKAGCETILGLSTKQSIYDQIQALIKGVGINPKTMYARQAIVTSYKNYKVTATAQAGMVVDTNPPDNCSAYNPDYHYPAMVKLCKRLGWDHKSFRPGELPGGHMVWVTV